MSFKAWATTQIYNLKNLGIHDWIMVLATVVIAIATGFYTHYAGKTLDAINAQLDIMAITTMLNAKMVNQVAEQTRTMGGQLEQMRSGSAQTDKLIGETHILATNAGKQAQNAANEVAKLGDLVRATNKQAIATEGQLSVMQKQFEASERPLVDAELAPDGPISFDSQGARIGFTVTMVNLGHSAAVNIAVEFGASNSTSFGTSQIEAVCARFNSGKRIPGLGDTIFPGRPLTRRFFAVISKKDLANRIIGPFVRDGEDPDKRFAPIIFGCVDYRFDFAEGDHQTWFAYNVYAMEPSGQVLYPAKDEGNIFQDRIRMPKLLSAGHWAN